MLATPALLKGLQMIIGNAHKLNNTSQIPLFQSLLAVKIVPGLQIPELPVGPERRD